MSMRERRYSAAEMVNVVGHTLAWALATAFLTAMVACGSPSAPEDDEVVVVEMTPEDMQLVVGDTVRVQAMPYDDAGDPLLGASIQWSASPGGVVEVSSTGLVRARLAGVGFVTAVSGGVEGVTEVAVIDPSAPVPTIAALEPESATAGSATLPLIVRGTYFGAGSVIVLGGDELATTRIDDRELRASIPASALEDSGTWEIRVTRYGSTSDASIFTVEPTGSGQGAPLLSMLSPASRTAGSVAFTLVVRGSGFGVGATVLWNGSARPTERVGASELRARIETGDTWLPGIANVQIAVPGGTETAPMPFTIETSDVRTVDVSPALLTLDPSDETDLHVVLFDADGAPVLDRHVSFHSSNGLVATVDADGRVRALKGGLTRVRVSSSDRFSYVSVTVTDAPVLYLSVTPLNPAVAVGDALEMVARTFVQGGEEVFGREVRWWSADPSIATVDAAGRVVARARGQVPIWAESEGMSSWSTVDVRSLPSSGVWTFDTQVSVDEMHPAVGDTTWIDGAATWHIAEFFFSAATFVIDRDARRWTQRMTWTVRESGAFLGQVVRELGGPIARDYVTGAYVFQSDDPTPRELAVGRVGALAELRLVQAVGTAAAREYVYQIR